MWSDILDLSFLDLSCDQELSRGQELNYREWTLIDPPIKSSKVVHLSVFTFKPPLPFFTVSKPTNQNTSKFKLWNCLDKNNFTSYSYWQLFGGVSQIDFWKTYPNMDEFSKNRSSSCPDILQKLNRYSQKLMDEFSRNRSVSRPGQLKFRENFWMSFPEFANKG